VYKETLKNWGFRIFNDDEDIYFYGGEEHYYGGSPISLMIYFRADSGEIEIISMGIFGNYLDFMFEQHKPLDCIKNIWFYITGEWLGESNISINKE
jgi:hypothetical protein